VKRIPHATNTAERTAAVQNTIGSILGLAGLSTAKTPSRPLEFVNILSYISRNIAALYRIVQRVSNYALHRQG
jgi:hypothetical protein